MTDSMLGSRKKSNRIIGIIVAFFYITGIVLAVHAVMTTRTAQGAIAWSVSLVSFPFVSVPAYLVFGRSKFEGFAEAYEEQSDEIDLINREFRENLKPWNVVHTEMEKMFEADFAHAVELDPTELQHRSFWWRLGVAPSRLAAPVS